ncbi:hypothetical protein RJ639_007618 [Escallonia herrerae]|uniref:Uncharacterized protein n=1 Tax=Escallonia herrerae TaxID=1293975 RepID=A0AA88VYL1_9ASTE|nr:hypothetical protein RJ639_023444 [Escallonia herrerae]KAK3016298.1 hypothetical protein RJ639_007618 [Escallonia herrerae]
MTLQAVFLLLVVLINSTYATRQLTDSTQLFKYHHGPLLSGKISINLIWYGKFSPAQKAIVTDFLTSLSSTSPPQSQPSVAAWWKTTEKYYHLIDPLSLSIGSQALDENYSLGKSLTNQQIQLLAAKGPRVNSVNIVLTSSDVTVDGFCSSRCGTHGSIKGVKNDRFAYIWVGNSETQCSGHCAWPFHQPIYGPQSPPLVSPNNDVGLDGMVINLASLLAGTATNPFGNGYYQGPADLLVKVAIFASLLHLTLAARQLTGSIQDQEPLSFQYHNGPLLTGKISVNLIWYGKFKPSQRAIVSDFITSLSSSKPVNNQPSVAMWWQATEKYYHAVKSSKSSPLILSLTNQILDKSYSLGKSLTSQQIKLLASKGDQKNAINVVLTASDVAVDGFCSSRCGTHGSAPSSQIGRVKGKVPKFAYIWVGNSETQCPGQCAWPFHQPIYGPQSPPLVAPNNDVGLDGMVINLASLLAATATNPFGNGYYQGAASAPLEAASACPGVYGTGAYPGYAGNLLVDAMTGASYNAHGGNGRNYLLPALFDPSTSSCSTLV